MPQTLALEFKYQDLVFPKNSTDLMGRAWFSSSNLLSFSPFFLSTYPSPHFWFFSGAVNLQQEGHGNSKRKAGIQAKGSAGGCCTENTEVMLHTNGG